MIKNYTVFDSGGTTLITDGNGMVEFTLLHQNTQTVKIPVGATITVEEKLTDAQTEKGYAVFMTMPGRELTLVDGRADKVKLIGPTEDQTIRVFNVPSICKVTDADGNLLYVLQEGAATPDDPSDDIYIPAIFPTIKGAFEGRDGGIGGLGNYYGKQTNGTYNHYTDTSLDRQYQIQMLVDYEVPNTDVVTVDPGYNLVFTTASTSATDGYPFRRIGAYSGTIPAGVDPSDSIGKAVLTRPSDATEAFFTVNKTNTATKTIFEMSKLILDGGNATLTARGGALTAYNTNTTVKDCVIFQFEAADGGAVYTTGDSLTVTNAVFDSCISDLDGNGKGGGGIYAPAVTAGELTVQSCTATSNGGGVYLNGADFNMNGGTIQECVSTGNGGAVFITGSAASAQISGGEITGNHADGYGGGAIRVEAGAQVTVSGSAEITGNYISGNTEKCGGAIGIKQGEVWITGGTISGNYATGSGSGASKFVQGGAIFVDNNTAAILHVEGGTITGNYCKATNNSGLAYGGAINVKGVGVLYISGGTISGNYAQAPKAANAKGAGIYLSEGSTLNISGGPDFGGASFKLYATANGARNNTAAEVVSIVGDRVTNNAARSAETAVAASGIAVGDVKFTAPLGVYYMKETTPPAGYEANGSIYVVLVGSATLTVPNPRPTSGEWAADGVLGDITQADIDAQRGTPDINGKYPLDSVVFQIDDTSGKAVSSPDIAADGIVNFSSIQRKVILRKIDTGFQSLEDAEFELYSLDLVKLELDAGLFAPSGSTGVFFCGKLPFGIYFLHETVYPDGVVKNPNDTPGDIQGWWYTIRVDGDGTTVLASREETPTIPSTP